jgi:hypothetical protein
MRLSEMVLFALLGFKIVLIFFLAKENDGPVKSHAANLIAP